MCSLISLENFENEASFLGHLVHFFIEKIVISTTQGVSAGDVLLISCIFFFNEALFKGIWWKFLFKIMYTGWLKHNTGGVRSLEIFENEALFEGIWWTCCTLLFKKIMYIRRGV